jgi:two-component system OmpR family response regulator
MDKILIVDGYPSVRELLAEELAGDGKMVVAIGNPASISEILDTFKPDLVILDVFMEGKMKWKVVQDIREESPQLPVLIFTATYPEGDPRLFQAEGWVTKSFIFDELKEKINEVLKRRSLAPSGPENIVQQDVKGGNPHSLSAAGESGSKSPSIH